MYYRSKLDPSERVPSKSINTAVYLGTYVGAPTAGNPGILNLVQLYTNMYIR